MSLGASPLDPSQAEATARALHRADNLTPDEVEAPNWPVAIALMEAEALLGFLTQEAELLRRLRSTHPAFDPQLDLAAAIALLRERQIAWLQVTTKRKPEEQAKLEADGAKLRADVLAALRWLLRADAQGRDFIAQVQEGAGLADLIQDLDVLAAFLSERAPSLGDDEFDPPRPRPTGRRPGRAAPRGGLGGLGLGWARAPARPAQPRLEPPRRRRGRGP
jgi:hypothetical protein